MKKTISVLLCVAIIFSLAACGGENSRTYIIESARNQNQLIIDELLQQEQQEGSSDKNTEGDPTEPRIEIASHRDFLDKTFKTINFSDYNLKFDNIVYGKARERDMFILYDAKTPINTNSYGSEVAVNKYGIVVAKSKKVTLPEGGFVLSAIGVTEDSINKISVGDIVYYAYGNIYVYKNKMLNDYNDVFTKFYFYLDYINTIENNGIYNKHAKKINALLPLIDEYYVNNDASLGTELAKHLTIEKVTESEHKYTDASFNFNKLSINSLEANYRLHATYSGDKFYVGGVRESNTLNYYDRNNLKNTNAYGYEVSVDKNGIVVDKNNLVELEPGGFVLSGHTSTATFLRENVELYDKIEINSGKVYIYRDIKARYCTYYTELRNILIDDIKNEYNAKIPHNYQYVKKLVNEIDTFIRYLGSADPTLDVMFNLENITQLLDEYIATAYAQITNTDSSLSRGIWYHPFNSASGNDDTTKNGVIKTLDRFKKSGINEVLIFTYTGNWHLFESTLYKKYPKLDEYNYGEYGHDYLKCFIEEAHKRGIKVNAFTQPFVVLNGCEKNPKSEYYQIDFNGNQTKEGGRLLLDICNDNVQSDIIGWYTELLQKYNFDKVEYDFIRFKDTHLYSFISQDGAITNPYSRINDNGYTEYAMKKFLKKYNLSGDVRDLIINDKNVRRYWQEFRTNELTNFVTKCTAQMKKVKPNVVVTAAVKQDFEFAKNHSLQSTEKWLELGILDEIEMMMYTNNTDSFIKMIANHEKEYKNHNARSGISARLSGGSMAQDFRQMYLASQKDGFILFSSSEFNDDLTYNILANSLY